MPILEERLEETFEVSVPPGTAVVTEEATEDFCTGLGCCIPLTARSGSDRLSGAKWVGNLRCERGGSRDNNKGPKAGSKQQKI